MRVPSQALHCSAVVPGKAVEDGPTAQTLVTPVGDPEPPPGFWLQTGP